MRFARFVWGELGVGVVNVDMFCYFAARGGLSFMKAAPTDAHSGYASRAVSIHLFDRVLTFFAMVHPTPKEHGNDDVYSRQTFIFRCTMLLFVPPYSRSKCLERHVSHRMPVPTQGPCPPAE